MCVAASGTMLSPTSIVCPSSVMLFKLVPIRRESPDIGKVTNFPYILARSLPPKIIVPELASLVPKKLSRQNCRQGRLTLKHIENSDIAIHNHSRRNSQDSAISIGGIVNITKLKVDENFVLRDVKIIGREVLRCNGCQKNLYRTSHSNWYTSLSFGSHRLHIGGQYC